MTIMTRFVRLFKADVHGVMDQLEDKGLLLRQYLREMETSLRQKEAQLDILSERVTRLAAHADRYSEEMRKLDQDVNLALSKNKDDIARALIRRHRELDMSVGRLKTQIEAVSRQRTHLDQTIRDQKLQYETFQARADTWHQRCENDTFASAAQAFPTAPQRPDVRDEEIELELIRRKESFINKGGDV